MTSWTVPSMLRTFKNFFVVRRRREKRTSKERCDARNDGRVVVALLRTRGLCLHACMLMIMMQIKM